MLFDVLCVPFLQIQVPGVWEMQGFGKPQYLNFEYPIPVDPPFVPKENPTGCYRRVFKTLSSLSQAFLVFDGVDSAFYCWLNGTFVGYSQDSRLPAEFDVSSLLNPSGQENTLVVQVLKWSDGTYLEDQDMWRFSGIHRSVYILFKPSIYIQDFRIDTNVDFDPNAGNEITHLEVTVQTDVIALGEESIEDVKVAVDIFPYHHPELGRVYTSSLCSDTEVSSIASSASPLEPVWLAKSPQLRAKSASGFRSSCTIRTFSDIDNMSAPLLWSAEIPNCYLVVLTLERGGIKIEHEADILGLRKSWISNTGLLLHNGKSIMLRGVNRHEHCEHTGRIVTSASMKYDAKLMKMLNFNAVRCSHYPNHDLWYRICSVYGLYVIDEANVETHGFDPGLKNNRINPACSPDWTGAIVDRGVRMYERDKNIPSILCWSLGNEAGYGASHLAMAGYIRAQDSSRPVQYEGGGSRTAATDIICPMYARIEQIQEIESDVNDKRPIILCEYAHSMGNSTGNVDSYWEVFQKLDRCQGGFVWDWADQAIFSILKMNNKTYEGWLYGGDFGDSPNDGQFICNGVVFPDRSLKPASHEMFHVQSPIMTSLKQDSLEDTLQLIVQNKHAFLSIDAFNGSWRILHNGVPSTQFGEWTRIQVMGEQIVGECAIEHDVNLNVSAKEIAEDQPNGDPSIIETVLEIAWSLSDDWIWAKEGHLVSYDQIELGCISKSIIDTPETGYLDLKEHSIQTDHTLERRVQFCGLTTDKQSVELSIDLDTGDLVSFQVGHLQLLEKPLNVCLYRAPTDNDRGGSGGKSYAARWKAAGLHSLKTAPGSCSVSMNTADSYSSITCKFQMVPDRREGIESGLDEGVGVGEVGGAHWFSDSMGEDHEKPSASHTTHYETRVDVQVVYKIQSNGTLISSWCVDCSEALPPYPKGLYPSLPRVGLSFAIPQEFDMVNFYGRGPHENYADRKASARLSVHSMSVDDLHVPYIFPGECGGRTDTRWIQWENPFGRRITSSLVSDTRKGTEATSYCQFSSSFFSLEELDKCRHNFELTEDKAVHVHIDAAHMGVGGDDSWSPTVHEEYLVPPKIYAFNFLLSSSKVDPNGVWFSAVAEPFIS